MLVQLRNVLSAVLLTVCIFGGVGSVVAGEEARPVSAENQGLVLLKDVDPTIVVELRYATENNFIGKKVYSFDICILNKETARKLALAQAEFKKDGYRLKVWDAYRPPSAQKTFWELVPDERYVADPAKGGSRHNRGGAVDVTLVDEEGKELEMPSAFDDFTEKASPANPDISPEAQKNVDYLHRVMMQNGFEPLETEWWHFDDRDWQDYPLVDVDPESFGADMSSMVLAWLVPPVLSRLDKGVKQAVVLQIASTPMEKILLTTWEFKEDRWQAVFKPMEAVIGKNGLALPGEKREGDGRTPSGIYRLGMAFGYLPSVKTALAYHQVSENDFWVDDPASPQYNQWVVGSPLANSFEILKRSDDLYKYAAVVEYNINPVVRGHGSAIFLHVWKAPGQPTAGCVAVAEADMLRLLEWLDRYENPTIVLGQEYLGENRTPRPAEQSDDESKEELETVHTKG